MSNGNVWVHYSFPCTDEAIEEDRRWRTELLGFEHWSGHVYSMDRVSINLMLPSELAALAILKYPTARIVDMSKYQ